MKRKWKVTTLLSAALVPIASIFLSSPAPANAVVKTPRAEKVPPIRVAAEIHEHYIIQSGDTLSAIAAKLWGKPSYWPALWRHNHGRIGGNYNLIEVGMWLRIPAEPTSQPEIPPPVEAPTPIGNDGTIVPAAHSDPSQPAVNVSVAGDGSFQQCVITRESGGNSQVMNSTGHYGLYQFSASTWAGHGGNPADFGHASVSEQNAVFQATVAADGTRDWAPYDGC